MNRKDARKVNTVSGLGQLMLDIKPDRCDSDVFINQEFDLTKFVKYMEKKKKGNNDLTYFHGFVAALGKTIYSRPKLNYFVANRHLYEHNEVSISFVAKVSFDDKSEEMMLIVPIEKNDNINSVSKKVYDTVHKTRSKNAEKSGANSAVDTLAKLPNILRVPVVGVLKWMDDKGMLPDSLTHDNIYYSSMIVSNIGSLNCDAIYHNIINFGTCSGLTTIGKIKERKEEVNGKMVTKYYCNMGINLDERVADGYYFIKSMHLLQHIFDNPELLDEDMNKTVDFE